MCNIRTKTIIPLSKDGELEEEKYLSRIQNVAFYIAFAFVYS